MAEKEEIVLITTRHKDEKLNMTFTVMYQEYTRQEAIERMAKAMCRANQRIKSCDECTYEIGPFAQEKEFLCKKELNHNGFDGGVSYLKQAEAALNALLEGK